MLTQYESVEKVSEVHIPDKSLVWAGTGGCSDWPVSFTGYTALTPASIQNFYEPEIKEEFRSNPISGRRPNSSPPFQYTPYLRSKKITRNFLLRRRDGGSCYYQLWCYAHNVRQPNQSCVLTRDYYEQIGPQWLEYTGVTHIGTGSSYTVNSISPSDVTSAYGQVQDQVANDALMSYDLLTDAAEIREIPQLLNSLIKEFYQILRSLRGRFSLADLRYAATISPGKLFKSGNSILKVLGQKWMEYRYAVMPLIYSYHDIVKTLERGKNVKSKKSRMISPKASGVTLPANTNFYLWTETIGCVTIRGSVFQHFSFDCDSQFAGVGINPFVTAWELIPYSFVIDWFVNVGDFIIRSTVQPKSLMRFASISQRSNYVTRTYQHYPASNRSLTPNKLNGAWCGGNQPTITTPVVIQRPEESQLLTEVVVDSYQRELFRLNDARLRWNPSLNWRRLLDAFVMTHNQIRAFQSSLKG